MNGWPALQRVRSSRTLSAALAVLSLLSACSAGQLSPNSRVDSPASVNVLDRQRGALLYDSQCVACHSTQMHWREHSIVGSWRELLMQVERWQKNAGQQWNASEIADVAAWLNASYYHLPCTVPGCRGEAEADAAADQNLRMASQR